MKKIVIIIFSIIFIMQSQETLAAKKTKWQAMLERNNVPIAYWQLCLPKVSRQEYRRVVKTFQADQQSPVSGDDAGASGDNDTSGDAKIIEGKYPLPDSSGKIAREQHLWLKDSQSEKSHYSLTGTPKSCQNGMAGGYGAFGPLDKGDKKEEIYYVNMRWGYADWIEPEADLKGPIGKNDKSLLLKSADDFPKSGYIKIENEYIRYSSKSGDKLKGLTRGYKSAASSHSGSENVKLEYKYKGGDWERVTRTLNIDKGKKDWYKKEKVLVTNKRNGKKVVASILESGPAIWTGRVGGLSPEAYEAISAKTNEDCTFQYVSDDTKLGPVD